GRDAHQTGDREAISFSASLDESVRFNRDDAGFLRLFAGIDLHQEFGAAALTLDLVGQGPREFRPIEAIDGVEERHRIGCLITLERADEAKLQIAKPGAARTPTIPRFADAVFAKHKLAGAQHGIDAILA